MWKTFSALGKEVNSNSVKDFSKIEQMIHNGIEIVEKVQKIEAPESFMIGKYLFHFQLDQ